MMSNRLQFMVQEIDAYVPEGLPLPMRGAAMRSGPIRLRLDDAATRGAGLLDYGRGVAEITVPLRLDLPDVEDALRWAGLADQGPAPVRAVLRSRGPILEDHSFQMSGRCELAPHDLLGDERLVAEILPGT